MNKWKESNQRMNNKQTLLTTCHSCEHEYHYHDELPNEIYIAMI